MKAHYLFLLLFFPFCLFSQTIGWIKTAGDIDDDFGNAVLADSAVNLYVVGHGQGQVNFGQDTIISATEFTFISKYDSNGNNIWAKRVPFPPSTLSPNGRTWVSYSLNDIKGNKSGQSLLVGTLDDNISEYGYVLKLNSSGNTEFNYLIPVVGSLATHADFEDNGDFLISGDYLSNESYFAKFAADSQLWNINLTTVSDPAVKATPDNGFIVMDVFTDTITLRDIYGNSIFLNATQGILGTDRFIAKYDSNGHLLWAKHYQETSSVTDLTIDPTTGSMYALSQPDNANLTVYDSVGNELVPSKEVVSINDPFFTWVLRQQISNGNLYISGAGNDLYEQQYQITIGAFVLKKFDLSGNFLDSIQPQTTGGVIVNGGNMVVAGSSMYVTGGFDNSGTWGNETLTNHGNAQTGTPGSGDFFLAKLPANDLNSVTAIPATMFTNLTVYPNPATDILHVQYELKREAETQLSVYDMVGNKIYQSAPEKETGTMQKAINTGMFSAGIYLIELKVNESVYYKKVGVER